VEALVSAALHRGSSRRWAVAATGLVVAMLSIIGLITLWRRQQRLGAWDAAAVLGVLVATVGHAALACSALFSGGRWPLRQRTAADLLGFAGWLSVAAGVAGATSMSAAAPTPRVVRGVQVNGVLEFFLAAALYSLPGLMLLGLRFVAFAAPARRRARPAGAVEQAPFIIEADARLGAAALVPSWTDAPRPTTPALEERIARFWEEQSAHAEARGRRLYNGDLVRLVSLRSEAQSLHLELGRTCFRDFVGTNLRGAAGETAVDPGERANPLGVSAAVVTRDGYLVLGRRRGELYVHGGFLHTFGGLVESLDRRGDGTVDLEGAIRRELAEEARVEGHEIADVVVTGLVRDRGLMQPELLFDVTTTLTRSALLGRFDPAVADQEHTALECVHDEPGSIVPFLQRSAPVAPVAAAAVLLHGKHNWGIEWFEQSCLLLYGSIPAKEGPAA
jgi:ADP-ribose pyrophosphatase YjhB (NUDIX family)